MRLTRLQIQNFRNIEDVSFSPDPCVNLITGDNTAGKTSILESIFYLSHVRSFRTQYVSDLIQRDKNFLQIFASAEHKKLGEIPFGIRRSRKKTAIRFNKNTIKKVSDIASQFPVLAIHPDSYKLITASAGQRRQYMDWGVFHVEHGFFECWQCFKKALTQRNAALKMHQASALCQIWDIEMVRCAEEIDQYRQQYINNLQPYFKKLAGLFFVDDEVSIEYRRGWPEQEALQDILNKQLEKDKRRGYTCYGPHRADISISVNRQSAQTGISRGQQKMLVALLRLSQAQHFTDVNKQPCVLLYDDLAAELDKNHRKVILSILSTMQIQLFLTAIEPAQVDLQQWPSKKMFHVEHGCLKDLI